MRGKIIQYNGADGSGTIVCEGKQHRFTLGAWRGDSAPTVNKTVELALDGETVTSVVAVGDDVLIKEKAAELGGKFGASLSKLRASIPSSTAAGAINEASQAAASGTGAAAIGGSNAGTATTGSILDLYGKAIPIAWALFLLGTLAFNAVSVSAGFTNVGKSLFDIASLMSQFGADGGGMIKVLLLVGYASIAIPLFWHDRRAWLALLVSLLAVLWAIFSVLHTFNSIGNGMGRSMSDFFSLGFGFYLSLLAAVVLGALGVKRFLTAS